MPESESELEHAFTSDSEREAARATIAAKLASIAIELDELVEHAAAAHVSTAADLLSRNAEPPPI